MYSLFLFTSALSYLALLRALERGGTRRWALWAARDRCSASRRIPYGALVLGSQGVVRAARRATRLREAARGVRRRRACSGSRSGSPTSCSPAASTSASAAAATKLGGPLRVLDYLGEVAGDFTAGRGRCRVRARAGRASAPWLLARDRRGGAARGLRSSGRRPSRSCSRGSGARRLPETRHLIFVAAVLRARSSRRRSSRAHGAAALAARSPSRRRAARRGEVAWAWQQDAAALHAASRRRARRRATRRAAWLAATGRPDDVLLGYEPALPRTRGERQLDASRASSLPRADAKLALATLERRAEAARAAASGSSTRTTRTTSSARLDDPAARCRGRRTAFEARVFGPYLVIRTREPSVTPRGYLRRQRRRCVVGRRARRSATRTSTSQTVEPRGRLRGYVASRRAARARSSSR